MEVTFHVPRLQLRTQGALLRLADWLTEVCLTPDIDGFAFYSHSHLNIKTEMRESKNDSSREDS